MSECVMHMNIAWSEWMMYMRVAEMYMMLSESEWVIYMRTCEGDLCEDS